MGIFNEYQELLERWEAFLSTRLPSREESKSYRDMLERDCILNKAMRIALGDDPAFCTTCDGFILELKRDGNGMGIFFCPECADPEDLQVLFDLAGKEQANE